MERRSAAEWCREGAAVRHPPEAQRRPVPTAATDPPPACGRHRLLSACVGLALPVLPISQPPCCLPPLLDSTDTHHVRVQAPQGRSPHYPASHPSPPPPPPPLNTPGTTVSTICRPPSATWQTTPACALCCCTGRAGWCTKLNGRSRCWPLPPPTGTPPTHWPSAWRLRWRWGRCAFCCPCPRATTPG